MKGILRQEQDKEAQSVLFSVSSDSELLKKNDYLSDEEVAEKKKNPLRKKIPFITIVSAILIILLVLFYASFTDNIFMTEKENLVWLTTILDSINKYSAIFALCFTATVAISGFFYMKFNRELSDLKEKEVTKQRREDENKRLEMENSLKAKELEIENLKNEGARIENEGKERLARVEAEANKEIARLTTEAEKARGEIAKAHTEAAKAIENAANANERAEQEALRRVELARTLSRRSIPFVKIGDKQNIDPLKPFAGIKVIIEFLPEIEPSRAASNIVELLKSAGWEVISIHPNQELAEPFWDGVVVERSVPKMQGLSSDESSRQFGQSIKSSEASTALAGFLKANNWEARAFSSRSGEIPIDSVRVKIGLKPEPRLTTRAEEEFLEQTGQLETQSLPRQRTTARHITAGQRDLILKELNDIPRFREDLMQPVVISCPAENEEAYQFAKEIAGVLYSVDWPMVRDVVRDKSFPRRLKGIVIVERWSEQFQSAGILWKVFKPFEVKWEREYLSPTEPMQIQVGW